MTIYTDIHERFSERKLVDVLTSKRQQLYFSIGTRVNPYSQLSISKKIGVSRPCLSQWESGIRFPSTLTLWLRWLHSLDFYLVIQGEKLVLVEKGQKIGIETIPI